MHFRTVYSIMCKTQKKKVEGVFDWILATQINYLHSFQRSHNAAAVRLNMLRVRRSRHRYPLRGRELRSVQELLSEERGVRGALFVPPTRGLCHQPAHEDIVQAVSTEQVHRCGHEARR